MGKEQKAFLEVQISAAKGAFQLLQLQEEGNRRFKKEGTSAVSELESHIQSNKETLMGSLWKLNVVDIEVTLSHVCQLVLRDNNVRKEELKSRAMALKILRRIFQQENQYRNSATSRRKDEDSSEDDDSSSDDDSSQPLSYRTPLLTQWIGRLFRCLCKLYTKANDPALHTHIAIDGLTCECDCCH